MKIKKADILIIVVLLALSVLPLILLFNRNSSEALVKITFGGKVIYRSLDEDSEHKIENKGHTLTVKIADGAVFVSSSDCEDKICMQSGSISRTGAAIVCLPADTVIEIVSSEDREDAVAG